MSAQPAPVQTGRDTFGEEDAMGLFFRPRRPLLRLAAGAATAGIAYKAGQRRAQQDVLNEQASQTFEATQAPPPAYAPPPAPAAAPPPDAPAELERLARLHESGALTDEEFTAAKARALGL
jgi:hypothetical protein